jgi:glycosyltransferase involved in cell wall biosynthesis
MVNKHDPEESPADGEESRILALIPAYNEASRVGQVIAEARRHLPVLVVDDGSVDETHLIAENAGATVIRQQSNMGKGSALKAGFRHALRAGFEAVVTLDADGQHDPSEIPNFLTVFKDGQAELIIGAREFRQMPLIRRVANWLGMKSFSWAMGQPIPDNQSGFRLIRRGLLQDLIDSHQEGFEFEVEMIVTCVQKGYELEWVTIRTIYAGESSHINPVKHLFNYVDLLLKTRRSVRSAISIDKTMTP